MNDDMVGAVLIDPRVDDETRRSYLYRGAIVQYSTVAAVAEFSAFAREQLAQLFEPHDPQAAHLAFSPVEMTDLLAEFKPAFIHHPRSRDYVRAISEELGCAPTETYFDVPKIRTAFPSGHLSTGIAYAFQAHRDTWYAAPPQQVNWWLPIFPVQPTNAMRFYPRWFGEEIENDSCRYNYYVFDAWRSRIRETSGSVDPRVHPRPLEPLADGGGLCVIPPVGGIIMFSGDHLHATVPNTSGVSRYSVDFRTVHGPDVALGRGAPRSDVKCKGTALRDFRRLSDLGSFDPDVVAQYDSAAAHEEVEALLAAAS